MSHDISSLERNTNETNLTNMIEDGSGNRYLSVFGVSELIINMDQSALHCQFKKLVSLSYLIFFKMFFSYLKKEHSTMKIEQSLNLVSVVKPNQSNPVVHRRERLLKSISRQYVKINQYKNGESTSGLWFWIDEKGTYYLPIKYGKTVLELSKGKFSIECTSIEDVEESLDTVTTLVRKGSFDDILKKTSESLRSNFLK